MRASWAVRAIAFIFIGMIMTAYFPAAGAPPGPCSIFRDLSDEDASSLGSEEAIGRSNLRSKEFKSIAQALFEMYHQEGQEVVINALACIPPRHRSGFLAVFDQTWFDASLNRIRKYGGALRRTADLVARVGRPAFRVLGFGGRPFGNRTASFHHGSNSIELDLSRTQATDWDWRFLHEIAHLLDGDLAAAHAKNRKFIDLMSSDGPNRRPFQELGSMQMDSQAVKDFIGTQLELAFVAEYRAWVFVAIQYTFALHCSGAKNSEVMEIILEDDSATTLQKKVFRFLDSRFSSQAIPHALKRTQLLAEVDRQMSAFRVSLPTLPDQFLEVLEMNGPRKSDGSYISNTLRCSHR